MWHPCKCANNKLGMCYGNTNTAYHELVSRGYQDVIRPEGLIKKWIETTETIVDPHTGDETIGETYWTEQYVDIHNNVIVPENVVLPFTELDCPGYIAPGQPMFKGILQGSKIVKPFDE